MLNKLRRKLTPLTLSGGLALMERLHRHSKTPRWYRGVISLLMDRLGDVPVAKVTPADIDEWYATLAASELSPWTINSYIRCARAFFNHMIAFGHLEQNPVSHVRLPKLPKKKPKDISTSDIEKMLRYSRYDVRNHAIVRVLADSGCRVGELVSMRVPTTDVAGGRAIVTGKGNKTRFIFFGRETAEALEVWMSVRHAAAPSDVVWLTKDGRPLSAWGVYSALESVGKRAGVERFNPHSFRHALAKRLLDAGAPAKVVQELLGHESISITLDMYVAYNDEELQRHHRRWLFGDAD